MNREQLFEHIKQTYDVGPDYPWMDENAVVRHTDTRKWFGVIMYVSCRKLGIDSDDKIDILNVKCEPTMIGSLILTKGFYPAYHMNKSSWITLVLGEAPETMIKMLLDMSYESTKKIPKR